MLYRIRAATTPSDLQTLRVLLREYAAYLNDSLGGEHIPLADYEKELTNLPAPYQILLIAFAVEGDDEEAAGCVLLKPIDDGCEMKRLWVRPKFHGMNLGRKLAEKLMEEAKQHGYSAMYLDTVPAAMKAAHQLYCTLGFVPVERYNDNPVPAVEFFRRNL